MELLWKIFTYQYFFIIWSPYTSLPIKILGLAGQLMAWYSILTTIFFVINNKKTAVEEEDEEEEDDITIAIFIVSLFPVFSTVAFIISLTLPYRFSFEKTMYKFIKKRVNICKIGWHDWENIRLDSQFEYEGSQVTKVCLTCGELGYPDSYYVEQTKLAKQRKYKASKNYRIKQTRKEEAIMLAKAWKELGE